jgi:hypothetical protein
VRAARVTAHQMSEKSFQAAVLQVAQMYGWRFYHTHDSRRSPHGWPDLALVHPGQRRFLLVELKRENGRVSKPQEAWIADLSAAGVDVRVWRPSDLDAIPGILSGREAA